MKGYLTRFWAWALSLAGLAGLYLGALQVKVVWAFWSVLGAAALLAGGRPLLRFTNDIANRYRKYPQMLASFAALSHEQNEQRSEVVDLRNALITEYERGVSDGASRIVGVALGANLHSLPRITALTSFEGQPTLVATYEPEARPALNTWFQVEVVGTGDVKGAVVVTKVNPDENTVLLKCCERTVPEYWSRLEARMQGDPEAPRGVRLRLYLQELDSQSVVANESEGTQA